jgi:iron complex outermembrane receptor protein
MIVLHQITKHKLKSALLTSAAMTTVAAFAPGAWAQDTQSTATTAPVEKVTVTGTRIPRKDYTSTSPIATLTAAQIKESGVTTVDQLLNTLPQVVPSFSRTNGLLGVGGLSVVDLRGLGPQRVLVLVDGRRIASSDGNGITDLNNIPATLVERVEVVTGGASAVYGSDAVSGVVNFIMKKNFEGALLNSMYKITERGDGQEWQIDGTVGAASEDGRGNVTLYSGYYSRDGVDQLDRDFAVPSFSSVAPSLRGSATGPDGRFDNISANRFPILNAGVNSFDPLGGGSSPNCTIGAPSVSAGSTVRDVTFIGGQPFAFCNVDRLFGGNRNDSNDESGFIQPAERYNIASLGRYNLIGDSVVGYMNAFYTNSNLKTQIAPSPATNIFVLDPVVGLNPLAFGTSGAAMPFDPTNTFLTAAPIQNILIARGAAGGTQADAGGQFLFRRRMTEIGARQTVDDSHQFQILAGLEGDLGDGWSYDAYVNYSRVEITTNIFNDVYRSKLTNALRDCVVNVGLFGPGCHSINLYGRGTLSDADAAYLRIPVITDRKSIERTVVSGSVAGDLLELPAGPVGVAFGLEYREDGIDILPDQIKQQGDIVGFNAQNPVTGSYDTTEAFIEAAVPLVKDVPLINELNLDLGYRISEYSSVGTTETYKLGGDWKPIESLRFRGQYQRADRAPNLNELFLNGDQGFPPYRDPCEPRGTYTPTASTIAFCENNTPGLTFANAADRTGYVQINPQVQSRTFGNTGLADEKTDTYTLGVVIQPSAWKRFSMAVDWYQISVDGAIQLEFGGTQAKMDQCFITEQTPGAGSCVGITRTVNGDLQVDIHFVNLSSIETSGVDMQMNVGFNADEFGLDPSWGSLNVFVLGSWVDYFDLSGGDITGLFSESATLPEYTASARFTYAVSDWKFAWNWRYIDVMNDPVSGGRVPSKQYQDASAQWTVSDNVQFYGGVNNLWDIQPPLVEFGAAVNGNTDGARYDIYGRSYFLGINIRY